MSLAEPGAGGGPLPGKTAAERRAVWWFGCGVMLLTTLPYLLCYSAEGERWVFSGFVFGVEDGNSYIAKMLSGWAGSWLFRSPYTAFPQNGLVMFEPYLLLGKLADAPGLHGQLTVLFHLFRIAAGMLMILASYDFISRFILDRRQRMLGLALAVLGGGLGWLLALSGGAGWLGSLPLDFISPEAFGFLNLYGLPHLAASRALTLWGLLRYLDLVEGSTGEAATGLDKAGWRAAGKLGGLWLLAGFFNPIALAIPLVIMAVHLSGVWIHSLRRKARFPELRLLAPKLAAAAFLPLVFLLYNLAIAVLDPFASQWSGQNLLPSPTRCITCWLTACWRPTPSPGPGGCWPGILRPAGCWLAGCWSSRCWYMRLSASSAGWWTGCGSPW